MIQNNLFINLIKVIMVILISTFIISSCTPERRLARILKKNPHLLQKDSVENIDSIFIAEQSVTRDIVDSVLFSSNKFQPIVIDSGKVRTVIYRYQNKTIVESKCKEDTIIHKHYNVNNYYKTDRRIFSKQNWTFYLYCFLCSIAACLLTKIVSK